MTTIAPNLPIWAQWFAALAVPIAAVVGLFLGALNYWLSVKKRHDELFDRQLKFFESFKSELLQKIRENMRRENQDDNEMEYFFDKRASRAEFSFPPDVAIQIRNLREYNFSDWVMRFEVEEKPIDDIFRNHLRFRK